VSFRDNDAGYTCGNKFRIDMAKAAFKKKKKLFTSKLEVNVRKKLMKCCIWSTALYDAETWDTSESRRKIPLKF